MLWLSKVFCICFLWFIVIGIFCSFLSTAKLLKLLNSNLCLYKLFDTSLSILRIIWRMHVTRGQIGFQRVAAVAAFSSHVWPFLFIVSTMYEYFSLVANRSLYSTVGSSTFPQRWPVIVLPCPPRLATNPLPTRWAAHQLYVICNKFI